MDYGLQTRSKPQDNIQPAMSRKTSGQVLFDSNRPYGYDGGDSTKDHRSSVLALGDTKRMPQCASSGPHGYAQDFGTGGPAIPVARFQR